MENRLFQWLAGDRKGEILIFDKLEAEGSEVFIVFKDGSRINESLVAPLNKTIVDGKLMAEIDDHKNAWQFKEEWVGRTEEVWVEQDETNPGNKVCVQPAVPGRKVIKLVPPRPTPKTHSVFGIISNGQTNSTPEPTSNPSDNLQKMPEEIKQPNSFNASDPVYILLSKSKKLDNEVNMQMIISLPPKSLYDLANDSFEDGGEKFIQYIVDELSVEDIKTSLKDAIRYAYNDLPDITLQ